MLVNETQLLLFAWAAIIIGSGIIWDKYFYNKAERIKKSLIDNKVAWLILLGIIICILFCISSYSGWSFMETVFRIPEIFMALAMMVWNWLPAAGSIDALYWGITGTLIISLSAILKAIDNAKNEILKAIKNNNKENWEEDNFFK